MAANLVGVVTIGALVVILFLMCRRCPKEGVRWPDLLEREIETGAEPRPPDGIKFYYV